MTPELLLELKQELAKPEYDNKTPTEVLAALHGISEQVVGKIMYGDTLHLVSMLARGLRKRIRDCQHEALKDAFTEALEPSYLASPSYSINVSLPEIRGMLDNGLLAGVVLQEEYDKIISLATYTKKKFESVTLKDVVQEKFPQLLADGNWNEFSVGDSRKVRLKVEGNVLPNTTVIIQYCESDDGETWTGWRHATVMQVVSGFNFAAVPHNGLARRMRWRGSEYTVSGVMVGV